MKADELVCPVDACKAAVGQQCKLVDLTNNKFVGRFHLARVRAAAVATRDKNQQLAAASKKGD